METVPIVQATLNWNNFEAVLSSGLHQLLSTEDFVDVTLACQGEFIKAHKNVLSVCSSYFKSIFKETSCQHPVLIIHGAKPTHIRALISFVYTGQTTVPQGELTAFLKTAETLKIKGLAHPKNTENDVHNLELKNPAALNHSEVDQSIAKRIRVDDFTATRTDTPATTTTAQEWVLNLEEAPALSDSVGLIDDGIIKQGEPALQLPRAFYSNDEEICSSNHIPDTQNSTTSESSSIQPDDQPSSSGSNHKTDFESSDITLDRIFRLRSSTVRQREYLTKCDAQEEAILKSRLPVNTMTELQHLESDLAINPTYMNTLQDVLSRVEGKNPQEVTERVFSKVIGTEILVKSFSDVNQCCTFRTLAKLPKVLHLMMDAIFMNRMCQDMTVTEVGNKLKAWLKNSKLRNLKQQHSPAITPQQRKRSLTHCQPSVVATSAEILLRPARQVPSRNNTYAKPYLSYRRISNSNSVRKQNGSI